MASHFRTIATAFLFTSLAIHVYSERRQSAADRARYEARFTLLEGLLNRARLGEVLDTEEVQNIKRLARGLDNVDLNSPDKSSVTWSEVFFGKRR